MNVSCNSGGIDGFFKRYQSFFDLFYCGDVPTLSLLWLLDDWFAKLVFKYHIQIKFAIAYLMALKLNRQQRKLL